MKIIDTEHANVEQYLSGSANWRSADIGNENKSPVNTEHRNLEAFYARHGNLESLNIEQDDLRSVNIGSGSLKPIYTDYSTSELLAANPGDLETSLDIGYDYLAPDASSLVPSPTQNVDLQIAQIMIAEMGKQPAEQQNEKFRLVADEIERRDNLHYRTINEQAKLINFANRWKNARLKAQVCGFSQNYREYMIEKVKSGHIATVSRERGASRELIRVKGEKQIGVLERYLDNGGYYELRRLRCEIHQILAEAYKAGQSLQADNQQASVNNNSDNLTRSDADHTLSWDEWFDYWYEDAPLSPSFVDFYQEDHQGGKSNYLDDVY